MIITAFVVIFTVVNEKLSTESGAPMSEVIDPVVLGADYLQDPHGASALLRQRGPVVNAILPSGMPAWLVLGHAEARSLLGDPRLSSGGVMTRLEAMRVAMTGAEVSFSPALAKHLLNTDPPDHSRLRKLVNKAFTPRVVERFRGRVEKAADVLLDAIPEGVVVDLIGHYAHPLPSTIITELIGVPSEAFPTFSGWIRIMATGDDPDEAAVTSHLIAEFLQELVESKRGTEGDDLLSALVHVSEDGARLDRDELTAMMFVLLVGGYETTVNLIASGMLALLRHPEQLAALRADRSLLPGAVEEMLRYETPNNTASPRMSTGPIAVGGIEIPAGEFVMISLLAANRDAGQFADPDRLDITRRPTTAHLGFGHGIHYCVGAPLGRMEGEIAFDRLLTRFGRIELAGPAEELAWRPTTVMRSLEALPLRMYGA